MCPPGPPWCECVLTILCFWPGLSTGLCFWHLLLLGLIKSPISMEIYSLILVPCKKINVENRLSLNYWLAEHMVILDLEVWTPRASFNLMVILNISKEIVQEISYPPYYDNALNIYKLKRLLSCCAPGRLSCTVGVVIFPNIYIQQSGMVQCPGCFSKPHQIWSPS